MKGLHTYSRVNTPNQSIAHHDISTKKHPMVLRSQTLSASANKKELKKTPSVNSGNERDCQNVLNDIHFKNFNLLNNSSKSAKINLLQEKFNCKALLTDIRSHPRGHQLQQTNELTLLQQTCGDGRSLKMTRCNSKKCKFQYKFFPSDSVISSTTLRQYHCVRPAGNDYINCHSSNCIYLITCMKCSLQYVGETAQKLNERFAWHNSCLLYPKKYAFCKILNNHFNEGYCKGADYKVNILEKLPGSGRTDRGGVDFEAKKVRKACETQWILKLRTAFPFGLNDRVDDEFKKHQHKQNVHRAFPSLNRQHPRISRGKSRNGKYKLSPADFSRQLSTYLSNNISCAMNFIRVSLSSMPVSLLKQTHSLLTTSLTSGDDQFHQWYQAGLDIIESKTFKEKLSVPKKDKPKNICTIFFANKAVELINLSILLKDESLQNTLPSLPTKFESPMITYKLRSPISRKIFNFNKFVKSIEVDRVLEDDSYIPCCCSDSEFRDNHHNHIITGDLSIVQNDKLRHLLAKGPQYREPRQINFVDAKDAIIAGMKDCITKWCAKHAFNTIIMRPYMETLEILLDARISQLQHHTETHQCNIFHDAGVKNNLKELQENFVIVPIDKAKGNVAFICKRFYVRVILEELGINREEGSPTYSSIDQNCGDLVNRHAKFLESKFKLSVSEERRKLPNIYWLPKLHKSPIKFRFIIAAPNCSIKPLAQSLTSIFKLFQKQIRTYNEKSFFFSGVKTFWVIDNNTPVLDTAHRLSRNRKACSLETFDFSTLYTKIPHSKLMDILCKLVDFCFEGGSHEFLSVNKWGAKWVVNPRSYEVVYNKAKIKLAIRYLMNNCYFNFGSKVFKQDIGIPMGSDPAPFFANLFLYYFENRWIRNLQRTDLTRARKFATIFRFIDDLLTMNDCGEFAKCLHEIYPAELALNKENEGTLDATFLDLDITIEGGRCDISLFDKRNAFPFSIVRMPFLSSNIPSRMFYFSFGAEILRTARVSTSIEKFMETSKTLVNRIKRQGGEHFRLKKVLGKMYASHVSSFSHLFNEVTSLFQILT